MNSLAAKYSQSADFYMIYVREAHLDDDGASLERRRQYAHRLAQQQELLMPLLVDEMDDRVADAYAAFPTRVYVVDAEGKVAYRSDCGLNGETAEIVEAALQAATPPAGSL